MISKGDIVVYESTVYPGVTEEECLPVVERVSGLKFNEDFFAGYSPERINPGDKEHTVEKIVKVTSGSTPEVADIVDAVYNTVLVNGTHKAPSIKVAEASKYGIVFTGADKNGFAQCTGSFPKVNMSEADKAAYLKDTYAYTLANLTLIATQIVDAEKELENLMKAVDASITIE